MPSEKQLQTIKRSGIARDINSSGLSGSCSGGDAGECVKYYGEGLLHNTERSDVK